MAGGIVVLGGSGLLGQALVRLLERRAIPYRALSRDELDLSRPETVEAALEGPWAKAVVNAAAFADVNRAELPEHRTEVFRVNRDGPEALARACEARRIRLVHLSTDYVFDGTKTRPYVEHDPTGPLQVYGESKLAGEQAVLAAYPGALVARTSTLFGPGRRGRPHYVDAIAAKARDGSDLEVVEGPVASPTFAPDLAEGILALVESRATGVIHVVNEGECSRFELSSAIVETMGLTEAVGIRTRTESPGALRRPAYSALDTARFVRVTGQPLRPWREALVEYLSSIEV